MTKQLTQSIPWSTILDHWERQDPTSHEWFCQFNSLNSPKEDAETSPYKRLVEINKNQDDTNSSFFDSLIDAIYSIADAEDELLDIDFREDGVWID